MYLHIILFITILSFFFLVPASLPKEQTKSLQTVSLKEEVGALPDPCYLDVVECPWKFTAPVTKYIDKGIMSNGKQTHIGAIACPRRYEHGVKVEIEGVEYICSDRTNKRLDGRFDIFTEEFYEEAMKFGKQNLVVTIK